MEAGGNSGEELWDGARGRAASFATRPPPRAICSSGCCLPSEQVVVSGFYGLEGQEKGLNSASMDLAKGH